MTFTLRRNVHDQVAAQLEEALALGQRARTTQVDAVPIDEVGVLDDQVHQPEPSPLATAATTDLH